MSFSKKIRALLLPGCRHISDASIFGITSYLKDLRILSLSGCSLVTGIFILSLFLIQITGKSLRKMAKSLGQSIHTLNLSETSICDEDIVEMTSHIHAISSLTLSYTEITDSSLVAVAEHCRCLSIFEVANTKITEKVGGKILLQPQNSILGIGFCFICLPNSDDVECVWMYSFNG